ncbi:hypothetical protein NKJ06_29985 [Mesorhizobium sp. M0293]|uniref:hypothetical protein n=1 Tax=Mesorhizobium sp. M0293 TaxID=2956930 RepID=UPI00333B19F4
MSTAVVKFVSRGTVEPKSRLEDFIRLARYELNALIPSEDWDLPTWNAVGSFITKGQNRENRRLHYYRAGSRANRDGTVDGTVLDRSYIDFAKAYCRYKHATSPVQFENQIKRLNALQFIDAAFRSLGLVPQISDCNPTVLNTAVTLAKEGVGAARHYQFALYIEQVHRFCREHRFYNAPFQWRHGVRKPKDRTEELGDIAKEWREDRLPSPEAYSALAHVFRNAETFIDKLMSAVSAICCSIPIRAHEVLQLRENCEVREPAMLKRIDSDGVEYVEEGEAYGIRVWPGKGNPPQMKWVPTVMVSVAQEAVRRLRDLCRPAREIAAWYEAYPGQLWLPAELSHLRGEEWITKRDFGQMLGLSLRTSANQYLRAHQDIGWRTVTARAGNIDEICLADLERHILTLLPNNFPNYNGDESQLYSKTLIVLPYNAAHLDRATFNCMIEDCTVQMFQSWLAGSDGKASVFERWGFTERDGSPIEITTHSFRHWLNTVAQLRGMSDLDIAKWSGRDPSQNKAYNHVTPEETLSQIRELLEENGGVGPLFEAASPERIKNPVSRKDFLNAQIGSAHITDSGICIHDYSLLPCQVLGDCLGCSESVFVKGDAKHQAKIEGRLELALVQLEQSKAAEADGIYGADRWTKDHLRKIEIMRRMLDIHQDDTIPDGTIINLEAERQDTEVAMALRDRKDRDGENATDSESLDRDAAEALETMWDD